MAKLYVAVNVGLAPNFCNARHFSTEIQEPYAIAFEQLHIGDDPMERLFTKAISEKEATVRYKIRKDYADILGKKIAEELLKSMATEDTYNGYPIVKAE